ncbi:MULTISPECIES: GNAT family N-acetyltransferase [Nocardiopsidaceae]|uniref:GNAT family protein n=1 Tax=Streptomonospora nanhaiensis TaxID=1323731 RepID=A0ABY6YT60_9ACTN|nr:GNAT family protein [Streptomonospora nanhaiensis]WAE75574.1 GNAT family protein [Streptomonospora nanhaiensis]
MRGALVSVSAIEDDEYPLVAQWFRKGLVGALSTGSSQRFTSTSGIRAAIESGPEKFAMVRTHEGVPVGLVQWRQRKYPGSYTVGGVIGDSELWDSGCGGEASWLLVHELFHAHNAHRIEFITAAFNARVIRMLVKSGMVIEGVLRDYLFLDGRYHDAIVTSYLRDEYYGADESGMTGDAFFGDTVPASDKAEARALLRDYMQNRRFDDITRSYTKEP